MLVREWFAEINEEILKGKTTKLKSYLTGELNIIDAIEVEAVLVT